MKPLLPSPPPAATLSPGDKRHVPWCSSAHHNATVVDCSLRLTGGLSNARFFTFLDIGSHHGSDQGSHNADAAVPPSKAAHPRSEARATTTLLVWKNGKLDGDLLARPLAAGRDCDFDGEAAPGVLLSYGGTLMTHNTAFGQKGGHLVAIGGQHLHGAGHLGLRLVTWSQAAWARLTWVRSKESAQHNGSMRSVWAAEWAKVRHTAPLLVMNGSHEGCIERLTPDRNRILGVCEFDGRISLTWLGGKYHLHVRQNPTAKGNRYVQHAESADLLSWSPFRSIRFAGHEGVEGYEGVGEIYTFGAQLHPLDASWLIAVHPLLRLIDGRTAKQENQRATSDHSTGAIAISCSQDGIHWSSPRLLLKCGAAFHRAHRSWRMTSLPVHNGIQLVDGTFYLWVHESIAGMGRDSCNDSPNCFTAVRRYRLVDETPVRECIKG